MNLKKYQFNSGSETPIEAPIELLEIYNKGYQIGYADSVSDLKQDVAEDKEEIRKFSADYAAKITDDEQLKEILEEHLYFYSYLILMKYIK